MSIETEFDKWYREVFVTLFQDESKRVRFQQQSQTGFFAGGKMAIDDTEHGFEHAKQTLSSVGLFKPKRSAAEVSLDPSPVNTKKQKL